MCIPPNKTPSHGQSLPIPEAVLTTPPKQNPLPRPVTAYTRGCAHDTPPNKPPPTGSHCLCQSLCSRHTSKQNPLPRPVTAYTKGCAHDTPQTNPLPRAVTAYTRGCVPPHKTPSHGQSLPIPEAVYHHTKPPPTGSHCLYQRLCSRHTTKQTPSNGQSLPIPEAVLTTYHQTNPLPRPVTAYTRGCAHERACPKRDSMWTRKYGFPIP